VSQKNVKPGALGGVLPSIKIPGQTKGPG
jgi:hypothetical protein